MSSSVRIEGHASVRLPSGPGRLPNPGRGWQAAEAWVARHLAGLSGDEGPASVGFRGGQRVADAALAAFDVTGYAARRARVWPRSSRGASKLSPYIRHGLLPLRRVWDHVAGGPARDVQRYRDELLWQEYARHLYARLGTRMAGSTAGSAERGAIASSGPWNRDMLCLGYALDELEQYGWLPNHARLWLASHASVRSGAAWQIGEEHFYRELLDGSRAANRLGWLWSIGASGRSPRGFERAQVESLAPGLCSRCPLRAACPIEQAAHVEAKPAGREPGRLRSDPDARATAGPERAEQTGSPEAVWITAESLGVEDPALTAHPELPAVFVFDEPLLRRLQLSRKRLIFLAETLAELAVRRPVEIHRGHPARVLAGRPLASTFTPVPGWRRHRARLDVAALHPWPWLVRPDAGTLHSYSAWRRRVDVAERDGTNGLEPP